MGLRLFIGGFVTSLTGRRAGFIIGINLEISNLSVEVRLLVFVPEVVEEPFEALGVGKVDE